MKLLNSQGIEAAEIEAFSNPLVKADDILTKLGDGIFKLTRTFSLKNPGTIPVSHLMLEIKTCFRPSFMMIPGVNYNGNYWGDGKEPVGFEFEGEPWSYAYHRTTVPGGTFSSDGKTSFGMFAESAKTDGGFSCSLYKNNGYAVHRLILPEEEMPRNYLVKGSLNPGYRDTAMLKPGETLTLTAYIIAGQGNYHNFLDTAWRTNFHLVKPWYKMEKIWELGVDFAKNSLWAEESTYKGFSIGLLYDSDLGEWIQRPVDKYESGWCGQNISLGSSMLYDYLQSKDKDSLKKGLDVLDTWASALLPCGLLSVQYDPLLGLYDLEKLRIDSCNLGGAAEDFIDAWELAKKCGYDRSEFLAAAKKILDCLLNSQHEDGSYPCAYFSDGSELEIEGSTGGFVLPAMLRIFEVTNNNDYLASAVKAMDYYYLEFEKNGFTTAGALDSFCIDKESSGPLLAGAEMLYKVTADKRYLNMAIELAYYLSTWQMHHSVQYPQGSALNVLNYDGFGGTVVSTQHQHIDCYAVKYIPYFLELAELTCNDIWRERAQAIWNNATIGISDGTLELMNTIRPKGGQDEAFFNTRWLNPFNVSEWLVAWPTAFRLEVLRKTKHKGTADCYKTL